jgi:hypothetical protein
LGVRVISYVRVAFWPCGMGFGTILIILSCTSCPDEGSCSMPNKRTSKTLMKIADLLLEFVFIFTSLSLSAKNQRYQQLHGIKAQEYKKGFDWYVTD